jgi:glucan phosphoethanolaminetransferase (alkaline phosphatase superfamily)
MSLIFTLLIIGSDYVFKLKYPNFINFSKKTIKDFFAIFLINLLISFIPDINTKFIIYTVIFFLIFLQYAHYAFFRTYIMPYEIILFFQETDEIFLTLKNTLKYMLYPFFIFIFSSTLTYILLHLKIPLITYKYAFFVFIFLMLLGIIIIGLKHELRFTPRVYFTSFKNIFYTFAKFLFQELPKVFKKEKISFAPYIIKQKDTNLPKNIIVVMGESLSSKRMSLFGYPHKTTPNLDKLKDKLLFKEIFSSATVTKTSVVEFFNIRREPQNIEMLITQKTNLFKLAKNKGYKTHYVTTQKINIMDNYIGDCDIVLSDKDFNKKYDEVLIEYLKKIDFNKKNFIVLHQRNSHSPYEDNVPPRFYKYDFKQKDFHTYMLNSYLNSVLYTDYLLGELINFAEKLENTLVFITSDHGEMLGFDDEKNKYGHTILDFEVLKVPLIIYHNTNLNIDISNIISHYQSAKLLAEILGYEIINPNEDGTFFANGTHIRGEHGFLKYDIKDYNERCNISYSKLNG